MFETPIGKTVILVGGFLKKYFNIHYSLDIFCVRTTSNLIEFLHVLIEECYFDQQSCDSNAPKIYSLTNFHWSC